MQSVLWYIGVKLEKNICTSKSDSIEISMKNVILGYTKHLLLNN